MPVHFGDESVSADDDGRRAFARFAFEKDGLGEDGNFDLDLPEFSFVYGVEPGIMDRGMLCGVFYGVGERYDGEGEAYASPEVAAFGEGDKDASFFGEDLGELRVSAGGFSGYCGLSVESCELQGKLAFGLTEKMHNHVGIGCKR